MQYGPSQTQTGIGSLIAGLAGGYGGQRQAQNQLALQSAYADALLGRRQLQNQGAVDVQELRNEGGVAKQEVANKKPQRPTAPHLGSPQRFDANTTQRLADQAFRTGAGMQKGETFDDLEPERLAAGNARANDVWANAARASNQKNQAFGPQYAVPESAGDYVVETTPAVTEPGRFFGTNTTPAKRGPNPKWGSFGGTAAPAAKAAATGETFAQRTARIAAQQAAPATQ